MCSCFITDGGLRTTSDIEKKLSMGVGRGCRQCENLMYYHLPDYLRTIDHTEECYTPLESKGSPETFHWEEWVWNGCKDLLMLVLYLNSKLLS